MGIKRSGCSLKCIINMMNDFELSVDDMAFLHKNFCDVITFVIIYQMTSAGWKTKVLDSWLKVFVEVRTEHVLTQQAIFLIYYYFEIRNLERFCNYCIRFHHNTLGALLKRSKMSIGPGLHSGTIRLFYFKKGWWNNA